MVKLPDMTSLGAGENFFVRAPMPGAGDVDVSSIGRGMSAVGEGLNSVGGALEDQQKKNDALDLIRAEAAYNTGATAVHQGLQNDTAYDTQHQRALAGFQGAANDAASLIRRPDHREQFLLKTDMQNQHAALQIGNQANTLLNQQRAVDLENELQKQENIILDPNASDAAKATAHKSIEDSIAVGRSSNILPPRLAEQLSNKYLYEPVKANLKNSILRDPQGFLSGAGVPLSPDVQEIPGQPTDLKVNTDRLIPSSQQPQTATPPQTSDLQQNFSSRMSGVINAPARQAIDDVSGAYSFKPGVLPSLINLESGWDTKNTTGRYSGLTQMGKDTFDEAGGKLAGMTYSQYLQADPADQIKAYGAWLQHYDFDEKMQRNGIDFASLPANRQAAVLQAFQFGPNNERWMRAAAQGDWDTPVTNTRQAAVLGSTSLNDMAAYYGKTAQTQTADAGLAKTDATYTAPAQPASTVPRLRNDMGVLSPADRQELIDLAHKQIEEFHAANWESAKSQVENDIARIQDGLSPVAQPDGGTSLDAAMKMAGDKRAKDAQALQHKWNLAIYSNNLKAPLAGMSYLDRMKFLNDPENLPRGENYAEMKQEHNEALKVSDEIDRLRVTDPSKSVSGFTVSKIKGGDNSIPAAPEVQAAIAEANKKRMVTQLDGSSVPVDAYTDPQKWGLIIQGRRAALTKAGVAPVDQVVLTRPEAESLMGMRSEDVRHYEDPKENSMMGPGMDQSVFAKKMNDAAQRAKEWFGPNAETAMRSAMKLMVHDSVRDKAANDAMAELAVHGTLTPATVDAVINSGKIDPLASFVGKGSVAARADTSLPRPTMATEQTQGETPRKEEIQALQANPGGWQEFAKRYGADATVRALTGGTLKTPGLQDKTASFWDHPIGTKRPNQATTQEADQFNNAQVPANAEIPQPAPPPPSGPSPYGNQTFGGNTFGGARIGGKKFGGQRFGGLNTMETQ